MENNLTPNLLYYCFNEFLNNKNKNNNQLINNFLKGIKWSPDGTCFLTNSEDNIIRLFELPIEIYQQQQQQQNIEQHIQQYINQEENINNNISSILKIHESESIYDYCWYPLMNSNDHLSSFFLSTSKSQPIHMWDAFTGMLRSSYLAYDDSDELISAYSLAMNSQKIYCGFNSFIRIFDINRPGRDCEQIPSFEKNKNKNSQKIIKGIISCINFSNSTTSNILALGSYSNTIALFSMNSHNNQPITILNANQIHSFPIGTGVTQIMFSPDGYYLFTAHRKSEYILCWDIRNSSQIVFSINRHINDLNNHLVITNQKIQFDIHISGHYLIAGSESGIISIFSLLKSGELITSWKAHSDAVNGCNFHPFLPIIGTSSGQRHFILPQQYQDDNNDSDKEDNIEDKIDNSIAIWDIKNFLEI